MFNFSFLVYSFKYRHERNDNLISYKPLWETMKEKGISQYKLQQLGIDTRLTDALRKNRSITMYNLEKLCKLLNCKPNDIVEFIDE